jgi:Na+:H+ antiporter, NhaA family
LDVTHRHIRWLNVSSVLSPPLDEADHVKGAADAPLELVMYGDFQCPYCLASQAVLRRVHDRLGERLRFGFRHLPVVERHPLAGIAAEASEAAAAQGRFWDYHDAVYAAQPRLTRDELIKIARELGLDADRLAAELEAGTWGERVQRDVRSATISGVRGTPAFFVNGRLHEDVYDAGSLVAALEAAGPG